MIPTIVLLMSLVTAVDAVEASPVDLDLQCEKTRVTVCMWMLSPKQTANNSDKKGDATHRNCACHGTMMVKSGDGLIDIPCPCGKYCTGECKKTSAAPVPTLQEIMQQLESEMTEKLLAAIKTEPKTEPVPEPIVMQPPAAKLPVRQLLLVGAKWCLPCKQPKETAKALKDGKWDVSDTDMRALISVVDFDTQFDAIKTYGITHLPTLLLLNDGVVEDRWVGSDIPLDQWDFTNLLLGKGNQKRTYITPRGRTIDQFFQENPAKTKTAPPPAVKANEIPGAVAIPADRLQGPQFVDQVPQTQTNAPPLTWYQSNGTIRPGRTTVPYQTIVPLTLQP